MAPRWRNSLEGSRMNRLVEKFLLLNVVVGCGPPLYVDVEGYDQIFNQTRHCLE